MRFNEFNRQGAVKIIYFGLFFRDILSLNVLRKPGSSYQGA